MPITHPYVSTQPDSGDADQVSANEWNAAHTIPAHSELSDLDEDDHQQYLKEKASGGLASEVPEHDHSEAAEGGTLAAVTTHEAAADPHTGYRLESADHNHQSTGAEAGKLDHGLALDGLTDDDHTIYLKEKASGGLAAEVPEHDHSATAEGGVLPAGVAAMEYVSSITLTDDATADFVLDNSTYKDYIFILENIVPATDGVDLWMRTSTDGGSNFDEGATDYAWTRVAFAATTVNANSDQDDTKIEIELSGTPAWGSDTNESGSGRIELYNPVGAAYTKVTWQINARRLDALAGGTIGSGTRLSAADVDAVRFLFSSGNLESGVIRLYGLRAA